MIGWLDADKLADRCVSVPCCCRRWSSAHVESRDLTLALSPFLSVLSAVCRVNSKHLFHFPSSSVPRCSASPFLPVIYILTALSFRFYHLCQTAFFFKNPPFLFCLSLVLLLFCPSPCSASSAALCLDDKLLFAGREWAPALHGGRCVCRVWLLLFVVCYAHTATPEDVPESSCPILKHTCTQSPGVLCCGQASALHHRATLINYRTLQC